MIRKENFKKRYISFGILGFAVALLALVFAFSSKKVDTESYAKKSESKVVKNVTKSQSTSSSTQKVEASTEQSSSSQEQATPDTSVATQSVPVEQVAQPTPTPSTEVAQQVVPAQPSVPTTQYAATPVTYYQSNGNTAGAIGSQAAAQMAAATGVPQSTWEAIIARESNGNPYVSNASGASGLFQTMPGWGSTATVQDQINSAISAYNAQGLSAWGY
ncbi:transglycosylase SLT domain-containing protein [Streptococcus uberis]|uniref:Transglycosylase protein n=2 Tax=Streptococcus uberis TaxID=1349 RepID=B9DWD7_STRU0|nr:transglycosylase SLT domain-containing protein [Streptococcus uberis]KHD40012.1 transglycosylase [Streptococcus hongkongensis]AUC25834.1 transglycosylase [Streptococcus uberis]KKF40521.1 transglycosylase [Streptococcus uberis Ab71]KKF40956.1 transglycosylase [Streptococcus uberis C9359]KKF41408.1 transglycosylase [Streptococcus uberis EF20/0145]